jgi:hypothetical protein
VSADKPYDATAKELLETDPGAWAALFGVARPPGGVRVIDSDLSSISLVTDRVLRVEDAPPWLLHVEFQSSWDGWFPRRLLAYNAVLAEKHELPVASVVVLLAPRADGSALTGRYAVTPPLGPPWEFAYTVVRVWQLPVEVLLTGPPVLLPLAPVAAVAQADVPAVLERVGRRIRQEVPDDVGGKLMVAISFLLQLRYDPMTADELMKIAPNVRELPGFRSMLEEGRAEGRAEGAATGLHDMLLAQGGIKFGTPPSREQEAALGAVTDVPRLRALCVRLLSVSSWEELLRSE